MIAGIGAGGQINALYPQYNVNRIQPMKKLQSVDSEDSVKIGDKQEEKDSSLSLPDELKNAKEVSYSKNPYDQAKKLADSTLLVGQNLDLVA